MIGKVQGIFQASFPKNQYVDSLAAEKISAVINGLLLTLKFITSDTKNQITNKVGEIINAEYQGTQLNSVLAYITTIVTLINHEDHKDLFLNLIQHIQDKSLHADYKTSSRNY